MSPSPLPSPADAWLTAPRQTLAFDFDRADLRVRDPEFSKPRSWLSRRHPDPDHQIGIPCVMMRGGTSKGLFFRARDLPPSRRIRDRVLLAALGSPDPRQINGCGGGDSLTSKVAILAPSTDPEHDIDYLFAQVMVDRALVDTSPSCGNILAGAACYAIDEGLVAATPPFTRVRIRAVNSRADVEAIVQTPLGRVHYPGTHSIDGVPGTGAPIVLNFRNIIGSKTGRLLPTGNSTDIIEGIPVTCLDAAMPMVILRADSLGLDGDLPPQEYNENRELLERLERIRRLAAELMGLGNVVGKVIPKLALISPSRHGGRITSRYFVPEKCHSTHAVTGAIAVATGSVLPGSVFEGLAPTLKTGRNRIDIEHPAGRITVNLESARENDQLLIERAGVISTARRLFEGRILIPGRLWWPDFLDL